MPLGPLKGHEHRVSNIKVYSGTGWPWLWLGAAILLLLVGESGPVFSGPIISFVVCVLL